MGQEIVYCFKCQKRILGSDYAKGQAFQVENNICCAGCAVLVLETLPPKAKEQLLGKMFKATHDRQSGPSAPPTPSTGTRRIPVLSAPPPGVLSRPGASPSSSAPLLLTLGALAVVVLVVLLMLSSGRSTSAPDSHEAPVKRLPPIVLPPTPSPSPEEKRQTDSAKAALEKARDFARAHPKDFEGQAQQWGLALLEAERTGYELEAKRELEKSRAAAKDAAALELRDFERNVRTLLDKKEFKAAQDEISRRPSRPGMPEWATSAEALGRAIEEAALRRLGELKEKALAARGRGQEQEVAACRAEVVGWGLPDIVAKFDAALERPWRALFDGRTMKGLSPRIENAWRIEDGMLIHDNGVDNAAMFSEFFGDGDFRVRFDAKNLGHASFNYRLHEGNHSHVVIQGRGLQPGVDHELILSVRGTTASATLDGNPLPVVDHGKPGPGMVQFNSYGGSFRIKSIEFRPAP